MIEEAFYDLSTVAPVAGRTTAFTRPDDAHWAGAVERAPGDRFHTYDDQRTDILIMRGDVTGGSGEPRSQGWFLSLRQGAIFTAGADGAALIVLRNGHLRPDAARTKHNRS